MRYWKNLQFFGIFFLFAFLFGCSSEKRENKSVSVTSSVPVSTDSSSLQTSAIPETVSAETVSSDNVNERTSAVSASSPPSADRLKRPSSNHLSNDKSIDENIGEKQNINSKATESVKASADSKIIPAAESETGDRKLDWTVGWDPDDVNDSIRKKILARAEKKWSELKLFPAVDDSAAAAQGVRVLRGKKVVLYTDFPSAPFIDEIPLILDLARERLAEFFKLDPSAMESFKIDAFLIRDKQRFQRLGVFNGVPEFENGYSILNRIYAFEQNTDYYNRFLLIHELTHSFMFRFFGELMPRWYIEGMAEYLALNRHENGRFELGIIPNCPEEVPGFGRIQNIQKLVQGGNILIPEKIFHFIASDYKNVETYGWSWAMVVFLIHHPEYGKEMRKLPYLMMDQQMMSPFYEILKNKGNRFLFEWFHFIRSFDFSYNFQANEVEIHEGHSFTQKTDLDLLANHSWQSSGLKLEKGQKYRIRAVGRFEIYDERGALPCEPNGITLRYYQGEPLGKLMGTVLIEDNSSEVSMPEMTAIGSQVYFTPKASGTLYFRVNCSGAELTKNRGIFKVRVEPVSDESENDR